MKSNARKLTETMKSGQACSSQNSTVVDMDSGVSYGILSKPTILLVEDDEVTAYMLKFMLEREGYDVTHVPDGKQASETINSEHHFSLALLDVMIPYKSGVELIADIRNLPSWDKIPVIMLSGKSQEKDIIDALDAGAADYIVKPFKPGEVLARIRKSVMV